jgi:hypothetical protein
MTLKILLLKTISNMEFCKFLLILSNKHPLKYLHCHDREIRVIEILRFNYNYGQTLRVRYLIALISYFK